MSRAMVAFRKRLWALDRSLLMAVLLIGSVFPVDLFPGSLPAQKGIDGQYSGKQGQIIVVKIPADEVEGRVQGRFLGRTVTFFPEFRQGEPKGFVALLGVDMQDEPGTHELAVDVKNGGQVRQLSYNILVVK